MMRCNWSSIVNTGDDSVIQPESCYFLLENDADAEDDA